MRPVLDRLGHDRAGLTSAPAPAPARAPGDLLLHPVMVLATGVLALNDHWLKGRLGAEPVVGVATGKLSDVAGLAVLPALMVSVVEVARWALRRDSGGWALGRRGLRAAMAATAAGFAAVQVVPAAATGYEVALGVLRWCPAGVAAAVGGGSWPALPRVDHVMDASDILCLPAVLASDRAARRAGCRARASAAVQDGRRSP